MIEKKNIIKLLSNRKVYNKLFNHKFSQLLIFLGKDKLLVFGLVFVTALLSYSAKNKHSNPLGIMLLMAGLIICLLIFCYYAFRAHYYKRFMNEVIPKGEELQISKLIKITEGKVRAIYTSSEDIELLKDIKNSLNSDSDISEITDIYLNKRLHAPKRSNYRRRLLKAMETKISDTIYQQYNTELYYNINGLSDTLILLDEKDVTEVYSRYDEWSRIKISNTDVPWLICRIIVVSIFTAIVLFLIALFTGLIG